MKIHKNLIFFSTVATARLFVQIDMVGKVNSWLIELVHVLCRGKIPIGRCSFNTVLMSSFDVLDTYRQIYVAGTHIVNDLNVTLITHHWLLVLIDIY